MSFEMDRKQYTQMFGPAEDIPTPVFDRGIR